MHGRVQTSKADTQSPLPPALHNSVGEGKAVVPVGGSRFEVPRLCTPGDTPHRTPSGHMWVVMVIARLNP